MELNGSVAQICNFAAEHIAVQAVLVRWVFVGMEGDGSMDLAVVEIPYVALLIWFIVFIEELLHLRTQETDLYYCH